MRFYCVKCRRSVESESHEIRKTKNGRRMAQSKCGECGTRISRFLPSE